MTAADALETEPKIRAAARMLQEQILPDQEKKI
jgi:hypothetical protein